MCMFSRPCSCLSWLDGLFWLDTPAHEEAAALATPCCPFARSRRTASSLQEDAKDSGSKQAARDDAAGLYVLMDGCSSAAARYLWASVPLVSEGASSDGLSSPQQ